MRFGRIIATLLFLTVWMTAREHCNLEAVGLLADACSEDCGQAAWENDGCDTVEKASCKQSLDHVHVTQPVLLLCLFAAPPPAEPADEAGAAARERFSEPQVRVRTWQFLERAAPPSRAPAMNA